MARRSDSAGSSSPAARRNMSDAVDVKPLTAAVTFSYYGMEREESNEDISNSVTLSCFGAQSAAPSVSAASTSHAASAHSDAGEAAASSLSSWVRVDFGPTGVLRAYYACCWHGCDHTTFMSDEELRDHLLAHAHAAVEHMSADNTLISCGVIGCSTNLFTICAGDNGYQRRCFTRHVLSHVYHANRMMQGLGKMRQFCGPAAADGCDGENGDHDEAFPDMETLLTSCPCASTTRSVNCLANEGEPLVCEWRRCSSEADDPLVLLAHVHGHIQSLRVVDRNDEKKFACEWKGCGAAFRRKNDCYSHVSRHAAVRPYACPKCGTFFGEAGRLKQHLLRAAANEGHCGRHVCYYCRSSFASASLLRAHTRRHVNKFKCAHCECTAHTASEIKRHMAYRHSETEGTFRCEQCDSAYVRAVDLQRHLAVHSDAAPYACDVCGKRFKWSRWLKRHTLMHDPDAAVPLYACHLCADAKEFGQARALSSHLRTVHCIDVPQGQTRFQYKRCVDGKMRLQTERYEAENIVELQGQCRRT